MRNRFYVWLLFISAAVFVLYAVFAAYREATPEWKKISAYLQRVPGEERAGCGDQGQGAGLDR